MIGDITPLLITFDEAPNIRCTLDKLTWAKRIVVIDSGSTDETLAIVKQYPQAEVIHRPFTTFAEQCNFGLAQIKSEWALSLDADYELSDELVHELSELKSANDIAGYRASFVYRIYGRPLRASLYPPRAVLYRVNSASYADEGHAHRVRISGRLGDLCGVIYHDDRKSPARWLQSQQRYAAVESKHLLEVDPKTLSLTDRIRRASWPAPFLVGLHVLFVKGCIFDGWAGWYYALQRIIAETMIALALIDRRLRRLR